MNYLALAKEFERLANIGIVYHTEQIVVGNARLLLRCYRVSTTFWLKFPTDINVDLFFV